LLQNDFMNSKCPFNIALPVLTILAVCPGIEVEAREILSAEQETCIIELIRTAPDRLTMGEARAMCETEIVEAEGSNAGGQAGPPTGIAENRLSADQENILRPFTMMVHRNNYILLGAHNFMGYDAEPYESAYNQSDINADDTEVQFQLSLKMPLAVDLFDRKIDIFAGYTVKSFWQVYNTEESSPFRETNYEPEIWLQVRPELEIVGFKNTVSGIGINHMSNGEGGPLSRSWNRLFATLAFERGNFVFALKPWVRIEEDAETDDNPDITDYFGHGELLTAYKHGRHTFSLMTRNNVESGFSTGAIELGWSFPLFTYPYLKGYVQYFSGYGESLIDYDHYVNRIGIGLQFADIL